jgi:hypothetical protein
MTEKLNATRRAVLAAAGASLAAPALAAVPAMPAAARQTQIGRLWAEAQALGRRMQPYAGRVAALEESAGLPGWMRLKGAANELGEKRYGALVAILKAKPESIGDLALVGRAANDPDIVNGPATWARFQFDDAARAYHRAA